MPISRKNIQLLWQLIRPHRRYFLLFLGLMCINSVVMAVLDPLAMKFLIDSLTEHSIRTFVMLALAVVLIATFARVSAYIATLVGKRLKNSIHRDLTVELSNAYYHHPYSEVMKKREGYYISRLQDEPKQVTEGVDALARLAALNLQLIGAISVALWLSWQVTLVLLVVIPVLVYIAKRYGGRISESIKGAQEAEADFKSVLGRVIGSYKNVHLFNMLPMVRRRVHDSIERPLEASYKNVRYGAKYQAYSGIYLSYAELTVLIIAGIQVIRGILTVGALFGFMRAYWVVMSAVNGLADLVPRFARINGKLDRVAEFRAVVEEKPYPEPVTTQATEAGIQINGLTLGYGEESVLRDLDLNIEPGEKVLLVGPNGCGKSTLALFLSGFLPLNEGRAVQPSRDQVSAVLSADGFFPGSVRDNLCLTRPHQALEQHLARHQILKRLDLEELIDADPASLSDGQKKKTQIAMALCKDALIYLFDEPLANVDQASKSRVMDLIFETVGSRTLIMVMHGDERFQRQFDRIISLEPSKEPTEDEPAMIESTAIKPASVGR